MSMEPIRVGSAARKSATTTGGMDEQNRWLLWGGTILQDHSTNKTQGEVKKKRGQFPVCVWEMIYVAIAATSPTERRRLEKKNWSLPSLSWLVLGFPL